MKALMPSRQLDVFQPGCAGLDTLQFRAPLLMTLVAQIYTEKIAADLHAELLLPDSHYPAGVHACQTNTTSA